MIQIFGGEPLLNMPAIKYICEYVRAFNEKSIYKTKISIVTNGTLIDDDFINSVNEYKIDVTVSCDGDIRINDMMRPFSDGKGSSQIVLANAKKLVNQIQLKSLIINTTLMQM